MNESALSKSTKCNYRKGFKQQVIGVCVGFSTGGLANFLCTETRIFAKKGHTEGRTHIERQVLGFSVVLLNQGKQKNIFPLQKYCPL